MKTKKALAVALAATLCSTCALTAGCVDKGEYVVLAEPPSKIEALSYSERTDKNFIAFKEKTDDFATTFAAATYAAYKKESNFTVSPASVYMALSLAATCAAKDTQTEILNALNVSYNELNAYLPLLYRSLNVKHTTYVSETTKRESGRLQLTNSIWISNEAIAKQPCLDVLANNFYCHARAVDFVNKNAEANQAVRYFVNQQTHGLIDKDFMFPTETLFVLLNTLYLKDIWNEDGDNLSFTDQKYSFENENGSVVEKKLLKGYYLLGRAFESEEYSGFYAQTQHGYNIKFLLPKDGYSATNIFTRENLKEFNAVKDYKGVDHENQRRYYTRCLFPEYSAAYDEDVKNILKNTFGITQLFNPKTCDCSALTDEPIFCESVQHATKLTVNKKGIEGAAVTSLGLGDTAVPEEYEKVYQDFIIDRAFGFIITDSQDVTLFSGVVKSV
ncbi:MAG: hypothetical protein IKD47_00730 [Clostridia bacterium]|nr:hypothetical protein [Clostridia bacterium]